MKITIDLPDDVISSLNDLIKYYEVKGQLRGEEQTGAVDEVITGAIYMYLSWLEFKSDPLIKKKHFEVKSNIQSIFEIQGKNQTDVSRMTGISRSTLSYIWNGGVPNLENFLRLWIALGKPPIEYMFEITPV